MSQSTAVASDSAHLTHIFCFSGLSKQLSGLNLADALDLGRYHSHVADRPDADLQILDMGQVEVEVHSDDHKLNNLDLWVQVWMDRSGLAQVHLRHAVAADRANIAHYLKVFCHERDTLRLDGLSIPEWTASLAGTAATLVMRQDVLQFVEFPAARQFELHTEEGRLSDVAIGIVYRAADGSYTTHGNVRTPQELNTRGRTFAAHGRGVVLLAGQSFERQEALRMTASELLFGVSRARRARGSLESRLRLAQTHSSIQGQWRDMGFLTELAENVRLQRIVLSLDVRAYTDGLFMPELVIDDFRRSFATVLRLEEITSSSILLADTLSDVAQSYLEEAKLRAAEDSDRRQRSWRLVVGLATGIALPVALLLSYFGMSSSIEAPSNVSVFDWDHYWAAWSATALISLLVVGLSVRQHVVHSLRRDTPVATEVEPSRY